MFGLSLVPGILERADLFSSSSFFPVTSGKSERFGVVAMQEELLTTLGVTVTEGFLVIATGVTGDSANSFTLRFRFLFAAGVGVRC